MQLISVAFVDVNFVKFENSAGIYISFAETNLYGQVLMEQT